MAANRTNGGGNYCAVHALASSGGKWSVSTALLINQQIIKTDHEGHPKKKNFVVKVQTDYTGEAVDALFDGYLTESASTSNEVYEDNSPRSVNAGNHEKLVAIVSITGKTTDGKRKVTIAVAEVDGGNFSTEANKNVEHQITFKAVRNDFPTEFGVSTLPTSLLGGSLATITLPVNTYGLTTNLTAA